ncbi:serine/threonine-protein kinase GRIK1 isoform X2 [Physcomitrium patens]|uniref:non-specific serine/threonine protein kinase n=1 Tax=Physcomitrium patens TaxID=3218 RepID=A0A2K1L1H1_PHYPA|nr:serine/threonine-protein kinase GRIK1-like isoform X2 [Physcomitrium patens]PNR59877.1 hypothetical protein PHYPA_002669 [Physcomitrium patens]|eukprot:XP_024397441.1 serine/threonine-protein kinase GRIK1-like isoform X2 [Physcomitrella patens]
MDEDYSCCGLIRFKKKCSARDVKPSSKPIVKRISKEHLLRYEAEEIEKAAVKLKTSRQATKSAPLNLYNPPLKVTVGNDHVVERKTTFKELQEAMKRARNAQAPLLSRESVKETSHEFRSRDADGNKMVNEYVWKCKIGAGSYGKVVLYQSKKDEKLYAIKVFHKSRLRKVRVSPSETAMTDVLREVSIMKRLDHPNIVKLFEVIDDPHSDNIYLVLSYVEGNRIFEGSGPPGGIGEALARKYFRDVVAGLSYLHSHNIIHGDIKPENLLLSGDGSIKICDFGVSRMFEGDDTVRRTPGTPIHTAPECFSGSCYHGRPADVWALGCTLYCMVFGRYPFVGDTTYPSIYDEIVNKPLFIPEGTNPDLADLLQGLLCKDVRIRLPITVVSTHPWLNHGYGQVQSTCYKTAYELQHPYPATGPSFVNGNVELENLV